MFENIVRFLSRDIIRGGQDIFEVDFYREGTFSDIEPGTPGLYAWYFFPTMANKLSFENYNKVLNSKSFSGNIKGGFQENYQANLTADIFVDHCKDLNQKADLEKVAIASSLLFSSPVYIGRSSDLQTRLENHNDCLKDSLMRESPFEEKQLLPNQKDTDIESSYFGERISNYILNNLAGGNDTFNNLNFIAQVIKFKDDSISELELNDLETFLNRTIKPVFGRN